mmetsp:Transcript_6347/g.15718  ORF Transcript_6347/g.15718 Transcript_6347/m.15718 type:complete len:89 (-) Transcript_6347:17-283(-)
MTLPSRDLRKTRRVLDVDVVAVVAEVVDAPLRCVGSVVHVFLVVLRIQSPCVARARLPTVLAAMCFSSIRNGSATTTLFGIGILDVAL